MPEGRRILESLTVHENLLMGAYTRRDSIRADLDRTYQRFPIWPNGADMKASVLSGGEQQMLAIGRALLPNPRLLMLDEPSLGLSPKLVDDLFDLLEALHRQGAAMLLVEQNTRKALQLAHRAYVLERGHVVAEGTPETLLGHRALLDAYLGAGTNRNSRRPRQRFP